MYNAACAEAILDDAPEVTPTGETSQQRIQRIVKHCNAFKGAHLKSSIFQLTTTTGLFFITLAAMIWGFHNEAVWLSALLLVPAAGLLVRLFIIQHDCGHGSFFRSRTANDIAGNILSLLTLTPYDFWRTAHNMHHASSGNLDRRCIGSIDTLTVKEYKALPLRQRFYYRIYRNPFILLILGTPFHVVLIQRLPLTQAMPFFESYRSIPASQIARGIMLLNAGLFAFYGLVSLIIGWKAIFVVWLPIVVITSWIGGWLFFIQHQFEDTYWQRDDQWSFHEAALLGSSYYVLPRWLQWFTGNIGLHHIHHLCPMIPNYRLQPCLDGSKDLQNMNRLTLRQSLKCLTWKLWDEDRKRMVSFGEI